MFTRARLSKVEGEAAATEAGKWVLLQKQSRDREHKVTSARNR